MMEEFDGERLLAMNSTELRWLENLKKAFYESDYAYANGLKIDHAFPSICKAVDVAALLNESLQTDLTGWQPPSSKSKNKQRFVEFFKSDVPDRQSGGIDMPLHDSREKKDRSYEFGEIIYAIRCIIHENENLNADESPNYHILLNWNLPRHNYIGDVVDGKLVCSAEFFWWRTREVLAKFITCMSMFMAIECGAFDHFSCGINPPLMSIFPGDGKHSTEKLENPIYKAFVIRDGVEYN